MEGGGAQEIGCASPWIGSYRERRGDQLSRQEETVSRSLNKVVLIGNLGNDPEVRSTTSGSRVATFSLATSRSWNDPSGSKQEKTEWHRCVVWNTKSSQLADIVEKYVKKGDKLTSGLDRVSAVAGQGKPDPLQHRDQRPRAHHARRRQGRRRGGRGRAASSVVVRGAACGKGDRTIRGVRGFPGARWRRTNLPFAQGRSL